MWQRWVVLVFCGCIAPGAGGQVALEPVPDKLFPEEAAGLSLEELMSIDVTSVAGVQQQLLRTPAAISVITNEDIRRSGHRSIAEALRLSPGMFVGQAKSYNWAIAPRGFNGVFANKTLVLMDGRRLYDPLQGGTFWDVQDVLLEDVDRIEVIRGPGPTLWGANAVNGVINIVTKRTDETQGVFLEGGAGTHQRGFGSVRYGGQFSENAWFSVWGTYFNRGPLEQAGPRDGDDEWDLARGRFRTDIRGDDGTWFTFEADGYSTFTHSERVGVPVPASTPTIEPRDFDNRIRGGHVLAKVERLSAENEGWSLLAYYDHTDRDQQSLEVRRHSFEVDARYLVNAGDAHALATGVEYYYTADRVNSGVEVGVDQASVERHTVSAFIQDTITIQPDRWFAMLGSKVEHNEQTGFEVQPSARLWFTPDDRQTFWGAISRPVRTPARLEEDLVFNLFFADPGVLAGGPPTGQIIPFRFFGEPDLRSEKVLAYELGYRNQLTDGLSVDVAAFYTEYDDLVSIPPMVVGGRFNNDGSAETYGGEVALMWRVAENWRLRGSYSYVEIDIQGRVLDTEEGNTPHNQAQLRSYLDLTEKVELNAAAYYVDEVPTLGIDDYLRLDVGLTWHVNPNFDVSIWGQNLLEPRHREFSQLQVERGVYIAGALRF